MKTIAAKLLVRLYPAGWRAEYGAELMDTLLRQRLTLGTLTDVAFSAARQRLHDEEPWRLVAWPALLLTLASLLWNITMPLPYETKHTMQGGGLSWIMAILVGLWTHLRYGGQRSAVAAAARAWLTASWPLAIVGLLVALGLLPSVAVQPSSEPVQVFAIKAYDRRLHAFPLMLLPLLYTPLIMLYGWAGAIAARLLLRLMPSRGGAS